MSQFGRPLRMVGAALTVALLMGWLVFLRPPALGGPTSYVIISGRSMEPTFFTGDLVLTRKQRTYRQGQVIAYRVAEGGNVIHRIIGGNARDGFITRGDNKSARDEWRPTPDTILGAQWLYFPGWGGYVARLNQRTTRLAIIAGLAVLAVVGGGETTRRRRRFGGQGMYGMKKSSTKSGSGPGGGSPVPAPLMAVMAALGVALVVVLALTFVAFRRAPQSSRQVETGRYEHTAAFDYAAAVDKSSLYPEGAVGPVLPGKDGKLPADTPPLYTRLTRGLDFGMTYTLKTDLPADVSGRTSAKLQVKADKGWTKTLDLAPPQPFTGPTATVRMPIDLAPVLALIDTIEKETESRPMSYSLTVLPVVQVKGSVGPRQVDDTFAPSYTFTLDRSQITPDPALTRNDVKSDKQTETTVNRMRFLVPVVNVAAARRLGLVSSLALMAALAAAAAVAYLGIGRPNREKIRARYGSMLVAVDDANFKPETEKIRVSSIQDLARMAQRDGTVIFHQRRAAGDDRYFIHHGMVAYEFSPTSDNPSAGRDSDEASA